MDDKKIMDNLNKIDIELIWKELLNALQDTLCWKWDSYFKAALAEFCVDNKDKVHDIVSRFFSNVWDSSTIAKAPDIIHMINSSLAGLRPGQLFFTSDTKHSDIIFCAWWPWGNGDTISIRIAPFYKELSDSKKIKQIKLFKEYLNL